MDIRGELPIDPGQELRYAAETQDQAYRRGAYDFIETLEMSPRMAIMAGYIRHLGLRRILDVGCGTGPLLDHLERNVTYVGVDISPTAIQAARAKFGDRPNVHFHVGGFREWTCPLVGLECLVWAGIARTWTRGGRRGQFEDWLEILDLAERALRPDAVVILEAVTPHWANLAPLIAGRYDALAGCDIDCLQDDHRTQRSVRVLRRRPG